MECLSLDISDMMRVNCVRVLCFCYSQFVVYMYMIFFILIKNS